MDFEELAAMGVKIRWIWDRLLPADVKPRHIGRTISAEFVPDESVANSTPIMGTLEARSGNELLISGEWYDASRLQQIKSWRQGIDRSAE